MRSRSAMLILKTVFQFWNPCKSVLILERKADMHPFEGVPLSFCIPLFLEYLESTYGEAVRTIVSFCIGAVLFGLAVGIPICRNRRKQMRA